MEVSTTRTAAVRVERRGVRRRVRDEMCIVSFCTSRKVEKAVSEW